jgi:hypothetical protein
LRLDQFLLFSLLMCIQTSTTQPRTCIRPCSYDMTCLSTGNGAGIQTCLEKKKQRFLFKSSSLQHVPGEYRVHPFTLGCLVALITLCSTKHDMEWHVTARLPDWSLSWLEEKKKRKPWTFETHLISEWLPLCPGACSEADHVSAFP